MLAYYGLLTVLTEQMRLAANLAIMGNNHTETHSLQRSDDHLSLSAWLAWLYDDPSNLGCFRLQTLHDEWVATSVRYQLQHICAKLCTNYSESLNLGSLNSILCIFFEGVYMMTCVFELLYGYVSMHLKRLTCIPRVLQCDFRCLIPRTCWHTSISYGKPVEPFVGSLSCCH